MSLGKALQKFISPSKIENNGWKIDTFQNVTFQSVKRVFRLLEARDARNICHKIFLPIFGLDMAINLKLNHKIYRHIKKFLTDDFEKNS